MIPSQDLAKQLQAMSKEAKTLEQTIQHRKSEVQAVQQKLNQLNDDIDKKTTILLAEQQEQLKLDKSNAHREIATLKAEIEELETFKTTLTEENLILKNDYNALIIELGQANASIKNVHNSISDAKDTLLTIRSKVRDHTSVNADVVNQITENNTILTTTRLAIDDLNSQKQQILTDISNLETKYSDIATEKELYISQLDAKISDLVVNLDNRQREEMITRNDIAIMQKSLDEQDKNLRIREEKVSQGEDRLVNNANLLNL